MFESNLIVLQVTRTMANVVVLDFSQKWFAMFCHKIQSFNVAKTFGKSLQHAHPSKHLQQLESSIPPPDNISTAAPLIISERLSQQSLIGDTHPAILT